MNRCVYRAAPIGFAVISVIAAQMGWAQSAQARGSNVYVDCPDAAVKFAGDQSVAGIRGEAQRSLATAKGLEARGERLTASRSYCYAAELWKLTGDMQLASAAYEAAIDNDPAEPATAFLYGEYLRNWRGLFGAAEFRFLQAQDRLAKVQNKTVPKVEQDDITFDLLPRALVKLYERDGVPVGFPNVFFGSGVRAAVSSTPDVYSADVRDLSASLQFAESIERLGRPLSDEERKGLIRTRRPLENWDRVRVRFAGGTAVDVMATGRITERATIGDFYQPNQFNKFKLFDYGVGVQRPFTIGNAVDVSVAGQFTRTRRFGLIEFFPNNPENVNQLSGQVGLSRFVGPDKIGISAFYVRQRIDPLIQGPIPRTRQMIGESVNYQLLRYGRTSKYRSRFDPRGLMLVGSAVDDREQFADAYRETIVRRKDYSAGLTFRSTGRVDAGASETLLSSKVYGSARGQDPSQFNSQLRTAAFATLRILDEERVGGMPRERFLGMPIAFLNLTFPVRYDHAREGPTAYENITYGSELTLKVFTLSEHGTTFLTSLRYDRQRFYNLNRILNLISFQFQMGF